MVFHSQLRIQTTVRSIGSWSVNGEGTKRTAQLHTLRCGLPLISVVDEKGRFARDFFLKGGTRPAELLNVEAGGFRLSAIYDASGGQNQGEQHFVATHVAQTRDLLTGVVTQVDSSRTHIVLVPEITDGAISLARLRAEVAVRHTNNAGGTNIEDQLVLDFSKSGTRIEATRHDLVSHARTPISVVVEVMETFGRIVQMATRRIETLDEVVI